MTDRQRYLTSPRSLWVIAFLWAGWSPAADAAATKPPIPLVVLAAKKLGVKVCLPAIAQAAQDNIVGAKQQNIMVNWDRSAPNAAPFFTMTALGAGNQHAILSITAIPLAHKGCALMVQRVFSSPTSCSLIAQRDLASYVGGALIDGVLVYNNPAKPTETYTLMQNSNNCTVVFRNDIQNWSMNP